MNYELAKQLKDAGFPQEMTPLSDRYFVVENKTPFKEVIMQMTNIGDYSKYIKLPTLSELIEACGDALGDLTRTPTGWMTNNIWSEKRTYGKTPEEAVKKLYLKLNEK